MTVKELLAPDRPATPLPDPLPVAVNETPVSAFEYVTPLIVTVVAPTATAALVVPPSVPVPDRRLNVISPEAPPFGAVFPDASASVTVTLNGTLAVCCPIVDTTTLATGPAVMLTTFDTAEVSTPDLKFNVRAPTVPPIDRLLNVATPFAS